MRIRKKAKDGKEKKGRRKKKKKQEKTMRRKRESRDKRRKNEDAVIISRGKEHGAMTELLICLTGSIERRRLNESGNFKPSVNAVIQSRQRVGIYV